MFALTAARVKPWWPNPTETSTYMINSKKCVCFPLLCACIKYTTTKAKLAGVRFVLLPFYLWSRSQFTQNREPIR